MISADSSSLISLSMNCMSPVLRELGEGIVIPPGVYSEVVSKPIVSRRFALGSMRINRLLEDGVVSVRKPDLDLTRRILDGFNTSYTVSGRPLRILHQGEAEALSLVRGRDVEALLVDERTTRLLIEDPEQLRALLSRQNNQRVGINLERVEETRSLVPRVSVIRSAEVAVVAYEKGILSKYLSEGGGNLLDAVLCALKFSGCSITWGEIGDYKNAVK